MTRETVVLIEKAYFDGFAAGEAKGTNPACLGCLTTWLLWRAMFIDHAISDQACTKEGVSPDQSDNQIPASGRLLEDRSEVCTN